MCTSVTVKPWSVCDGPRICKQKAFTVVFHQGQECPSPSGLHLLLLLLALFQERWWLEFFLLLGRRLGGWTFWGAGRWFSRWSSRRGGGVISGQGLHPFFQLFCHLLVLLTSVLDDCRGGFKLFCPRKKYQKLAAREHWHTSVVDVGAAKLSGAAGEHACVMSRYRSVSLYLLVRQDQSCVPYESVWDDTEKDRYRRRKHKRWSSCSDRWMKTSYVNISPSLFQKSLRFSAINNWKCLQLAIKDTDYFVGSVWNNLETPYACERIK